VEESATYQITCDLTSTKDKGKQSEMSIELFHPEEGNRDVTQADE